MVLSWKNYAVMLGVILLALVIYTVVMNQIPKLKAHKADKK